MTGEVGLYPYTAGLTRETRGGTRGLHEKAELKNPSASSLGIARARRLEVD